MKRKIFTFLITTIFCGMMNHFVQAQDLGTGIVWGTLAPAEPLLLNEKFTGFSFFHSDANPNSGSSTNTADADGKITAWGYKNDSLTIPIIGSTKGKIIYKFYQCAFAPKWLTAYAYRDSLNGTGTPANTAGVSNGFVEISRLYTSQYTVDGYFLIDLREIEFVEVIQYSHSSCGGTRRGLLLEFSLDNGAKWDTLRYQPGDAWASSFTKDVTSLAKTSGTFNCTPSAYGMTWEEGIYSGNVMLRFGIAKNQALRIHDLKVYGTVGTLVKDLKEDGLKIFSARKKIRISEQANVEIYNITGKVVRSVVHANMVSMEDMPDGIYLVRARSGEHVKTVKVLVK